MSENAIRKGNREKKPSRYHYYEDTDVNVFVGQKNSEQKLPAPITKDKVSSAQEIGQIAKLFCKFIVTANNRYHELNEVQQADSILNPPDLSKDMDSLGLIENKRAEVRAARNTVNDSKNLRSRDIGQVLDKDPKASTKELKNRGLKNGKPSNNLAACLDTDLNYHNAINEHLKNSYPNIKALSPDMLKELSIPTEMLNKNPISKQKPKEQKKLVKPSKEENKPFKRQSYHIAIAYHIHLKQVKSSKPPEYVDPTYAARKLREQAHKEGPER